MPPDALVTLIKRYEGFRATPYLCPAKIPTIGYGFTTYQDGSHVTLDDQPMAEETADKILRLKVQAVYSRISELHPNLNSNQLSALTSLSYNIGLHAYRNSTLRKVILTNPESAYIRYEFSRWNKAQGVSLLGLIKRRKDEADLYFKAP